MQKSKHEVSERSVSVSSIERTNIKIQPDISRKSCLMDSFTNSKESEVEQKYCRISHSIGHTIKSTMDNAQAPTSEQKITLSNIQKLNSKHARGRFQQSLVGSMIGAEDSLSRHRSEYGAVNNALPSHKYFANMAKINLMSPAMSVFNRSIDLNVSQYFIHSLSTVKILFGAA